MASKTVIEELEARSLTYILGARLRRTSEIKEKVLSPTQEATKRSKTTSW